MKISKFKTILVLTYLFITIALFGGGCSSTSIIANLKAPDKYLYPDSTTNLQCIVSVPDSTNLIYRWSCSDGTLSGDGPSVTWKAPNKYGDFHVMVMVEDSKGNKDKAAATIKVVVNQNPDQGCSSCGR